MGRGGHYGGRCDRGGSFQYFLCNISDRAEGPYPTMIGNTATVSAYDYGKFLGKLNVMFNDQGDILGADGDALIMDVNVPKDVATVQRIAKTAEPLQSIREKIVAQAASGIVGARAECRAQECTMGFLITDAMLDRVKDQGVQIAIQNSGGIRASLDAVKVTIGEVLTVLPFQNTLSTFEVSGAT